jgi:predicted nuclease of predicted toxin-antitoxin system
MAKLYSNENFPIPVALLLRDLGHDVATIQERGRAKESTPDPDVLALATAEGRAVLTLNRKDFYRLHAQRPGHAGILVCVVDEDFERQARMIDEALRAAGDLTGRIIRVPPRA